MFGDGFLGGRSYSVNQFGLKLQAILLPHLGLYRFKLWLLEGCKAGLFQSAEAKEVGRDRVVA